MTHPGTASHHERAPHYAWSQVFFTAIMVLMIFLAIYGTSMRVPGWQGLLIGAIACVWGFLAFLTISYEIDEKGITARLWPFRYHIPHSNIYEVTIGAIPWWGGMGYHMMGRTSFINSKYGPSVAIKHKKKNKEYTLHITPKDPDMFMQHVNRHVKHHLKDGHHQNSKTSSKS